MANTKPFVQIACVCEQAMVESDNVVSVIRVVDTFAVHLPEESPEGVKLAITLNLVVMLKSGDIKGEYEVALILRQPNKKSGELRKWPVVFEGGEHGVNAKIQFNLVQPQFGLYWIDVVWKDETLTSIPFRLKPAETPSESET